jgi:hypothetical protein
MQARACVRVLTVVAATVAAAGCNSYPYGSSKYDYGPSFERSPGYTPGSGSSSANESQYDYYRNYRGAVKPPADKIE